MKFKVVLAAAAFAVAATGFAVADSDIIGLRQQVMKTNGQAAKVWRRHDQGRDSLRRDGGCRRDDADLHDNVRIFRHLFPTGTETGEHQGRRRKSGATAAGFKAAAKAVVRSGQGRRRGRAEGQEAFGAAFGAVGKACGGCHEKYRQS